MLSGVEDFLGGGHRQLAGRGGGEARRDVDKGCSTTRQVGLGSGNMGLTSQRRRHRPERWVTTLEHLAVKPFPSADLVLLCGFGPDLDRTRTHQELRLALRSAGYGGSLGRHLILTSPMLRRLRGNRFALLRFTEPGATR